MTQESCADLRFEGDLAVPGAIAHIAHLSLSRPTNRVFFGRDRYWIDMCLTPRPAHARGCYRDRWGSQRYERLGEIFLVPPGEALHVLTDDHPPDQVSVVCEMQAKAVERWLPGVIAWTDRRLAASLDIADPYMRASLFRLAQEVREPGTGSLLLTRLIVRQLAIEIARYCESVAEGPAAGGLASWRLKLIDDRLQRPGPQPSLQELAQACGISVRQLTRGFRASRGCTLGEYAALARLVHAKHLLSGSRSIKEIAAELGFASASSFSYAFRRATAWTPRQFRSRQGQGR